MSESATPSETLTAGGNALLSFFLGPVQPFIAGARTVRDLWTGSYLLAWLTFAAVRTVRQRHGDGAFVSPNLKDNPFLWTLHQAGEPPENITTPCLPNRFIACVPVDAAPKLAKDCEQACHDEWTVICREVHDAINRKIAQERTQFKVNKTDLLHSPWDRLWEQQVTSFFEVRSAVLFSDQLTEQLRRQLLDPVPDSEWQAAMDILAGLMDARKSIRHVPNYRPSGDVPQKCTLLGSYEQMGPAQLDELRAFWGAFAQHISIGGTRVRAGERLCAVSLVKRFAWPVYLAKKLRQRPDELSYSDTATVAASCWLPRESEAPENDINWRRLQNWSGQWLHWSNPVQDKDERECRPRVWNWIQQRKRSHGSPPAYYGILMADADKLGEKLAGKGGDSRNAAQRSLRVSGALTDFALHRVRSIVEAHHGELIYSGGDDTLAVLPTETAVACAWALQQGYTETWRKHFPGEELATLSAGLAVVHYKEDLRFALDQAREAEGLAKRSGRDALALTVCRRSGELTSTVLAWPHTESLQRMVEDFRKGVSDRWTYRLRTLLPTLQGVHWMGFAAELGRLLARLEEVPKVDFTAFRQNVLDLATHFRQDMTATPRCSDDLDDSKVRAKVEAKVQADFVTVCQSASFLARGRDAR